MGKRRAQQRQNATLTRFESPASTAASQPDSNSGPLHETSAPYVPAAGPAVAMTPAGASGYGAAYTPSRPASNGPFGQLRVELRDQIDWLEDNPLALLLGGTAVGILAGLLLPASASETKRLGSVGENIAGQVQVHVQAIGEDVVEHGKAVVVEAVQATVLGGKSPVDAVQQSVQEHLVAVAQNAQARVEASLSSSAD